MTYKDLLDIPGVEDVVLTKEVAYVITNKKPPKIFADREVVEVPLKKLHVSEHLKDILGGESLRYGSVAQHTSIRNATLYEYSLKKLKPSDKQAVSHLLNGTGGRNSIIERMGGRKVGRSAMMIPPAAEKDIERFLDAHSCEWRKQAINTVGDGS